MRPGFAKQLLSCIVGAAVSCAATAFGAELLGEPSGEPGLRPSVSTRGGFMAFSRHHNFYVESAWDFPLLSQDRLHVSFSHRDTTPFLDTASIFGTEFQMELLHSTETLLFDYALTPSLALKWMHRYEHTRFADRPGKVFGYEMGFGLGAPARSGGDERWRWTLVAGPVFNVQSLDADWFFLARGSWLLWQWDAPGWVRNGHRWGLRADLSLESVNRGDKLQPMVEAGPSLVLPTKGGSQMDVFVHWIHNYSNPFGMMRDGGMYMGLQIDSRQPPQWGYDALDFEAGRVLPNAWARYDVGAWDTHYVTVFEAGLHLLQFELARAPITAAIWYQHRQEFREGDFDSTTYSVAIGPQTPFTVPLISPLLARSEPLVIGVEFLHRSDHALDPPAARLTPRASRQTPLGAFLRHSAANIWRFRFQTLGWDEPYRYKESYEGNTRWLGIVDWRLTLGGSVGKFSRRRNDPRGQPASQIAVNVDIASVNGVVAYARGSYSFKQETPNYFAEFGLKRPTFRLFGRAEDFAINPNFSKGGAFYLGIGINL